MTTSRSLPIEHGWDWSSTQFQIEGATHAPNHQRHNGSSTNHVGGLSLDRLLKDLWASRSLFRRTRLYHYAALGPMVRPALVGTSMSATAFKFTFYCWADVIGQKAHSEGYVADLRSTPLCAISTRTRSLELLPWQVWVFASDSNGFACDCGFVLGNLPCFAHVPTSALVIAFMGMILKVMDRTFTMPSPSHLEPTQGFRVLVADGSYMGSQLLADFLARDSRFNIVGVVTAADVLSTVAAGSRLLF